MKTIDFESQDSITQAIEEAQVLFGPWDPKGDYASDTTRLHNPRQHVVIFRTTCLTEAKMIHDIINAASSKVKEELPR